jgi:2-oxoglutarate ferredoxin oxidoreductase subunit alpha
MTEFLGLAVMAEVPVVVIDGQRGGPSTGLPTKTEQSDLNLAVSGGSGDCPRPVLAPADVAECYSLTRTAFDICEAYQTPVLVLLDLFLCNRTEDVNWSEVDHTCWGEYEDVRAEPGEADTAYRRFALTPDGVSPRAVPGEPGLLHAVTGLEHDERGRPDYTPGNHERMTLKRFRKMEALLDRWPDPEPEGDPGEVEVGIVSWGSAIGSAREALLGFQTSGVKAAGLFPRLVWPVCTGALQEFAARCEKVIVAESNHTGQYAGLVEQALGAPVIRVTHVPAEPLDPALIIAAAGGES